MQVCVGGGGGGGRVPNTTLSPLGGVVVGAAEGEDRKVKVF